MFSLKYGFCLYTEEVNSKGCTLKTINQAAGSSTQTPSDRAGPSSPPPNEAGRHTQTAPAPYSQHVSGFYFQYTDSELKHVHESTPMEPRIHLSEPIRSSRRHDIEQSQCRRDHHEENVTREPVSRADPTSNEHPSQMRHIFSMT